MTRRSLGFRILIALLLAGVVLGLGVGGYLFVKSRRGQGALQKAEQAYAEGNWREAKTNYTWYLVRHPGDPEVLPRYIESCMQLLSNRRANVSDAGRAYLQLALANRSDRDQVQQAIDFYRQYRLWRELDYAADLFLREFPGDEGLGFAKALANERLGRTSQAIVEYEGLLESGTTQTDTYGNLALLYRQQGLESKGRQVLDDASNERPDEPRIRVDLARYLHVSGEPLQAIETLLPGGKEIGDSLPEGQDIVDGVANGVGTGGAFLAAAYVYAGQRKWETAQSLAERALSELQESAEEYSEACFLVARCLMALKQNDEAIAFLSSIDPYVMADNPQLYLMLTETQINAGLLEGADHTLEAFRAAYPGERDRFEYLSVRKLLEEAPASEGELRKAALEEAVSRLEILTERAPELRAARFILARVYLENGQRELARNVLEMYLKNNPGDPDAQDLWDDAFTERSAQEREQELEDGADALLESETPDCDRLLFIAGFFARKALRADEGGKSAEQATSPDEQAKSPEVRAEELYEKAIEQRPSAPEGHLGLMRLLVIEGDLEGAGRALDGARTAGVAPLELSLLQAALALAEGEPDQARSCIDTGLAQGAIEPQRAKKWAFDLGHFETGLFLLQTASAHETDENNRQELDLFQVDFCLGNREIKMARMLIEQLAKKYSETPEMTTRLNDSRRDIARALLAPGDQHDEATAGALIAEVQRTEPERGDVRVLQAWVLLEQDPPDINGADELCAAAREDGASDAETFLVSGQIAQRKGQFKKALEYAEKANEKSPDDLRTGMTLARAQLQTGQPNDAITTLERLLPLLPKEPALLDLLARAYASVGRFREAEDHARFWEKETGQANVSLRAWLLLARGNWDAAEEVLSMMQEANPDDLWTIQHLARALKGQGDWDRLWRILNECVSRRPGSPELWVELGNSYLAYLYSPDEGFPEDRRAEMLAKASSAFTQALVLRADFRPALLGLLAFHTRSGNRGAASGLCDRLLAESPGDPDILDQKASLLVQTGKTQAALDTIEQAIDAAPRTEFYYVRGCLRNDLGEFAGAIEDFERVNQAGGVTRGDFEIPMAEAYLGLGNLERALFYYESAMNKGLDAKPATKARLDAISERLPAEGE
jgi:tetratricopeptide (TPR) repeat protein